MDDGEGGVMGDGDERVVTSEEKTAWNGDAS